MGILLYSSSNQSALLAALREALPDQLIVTRDDRYDPASIATAVAWQPPADFFDGLTNLKQVHALSAGVEQLLNHPGLPASVPIARLLDAGMGVQMAEYVLYGVLHAHRRWPALNQARREGRWSHSISWPPAAEFTVGLLGLGALGREVAQRCLRNGYAVRGWSRRSASLAGVQTFAGQAALTDFLDGLDVLVCLLPLTPATTGILDSKLFLGMPRGGFLINLARGGHLVEADLTQALDTGQLSGALLDVFCTEPLPASHPFWQDERILLSPHVAALSPVDESVAQIVENLERSRRGQSLLGLVDRQLGY